MRQIITFATAILCAGAASAMTIASSTNGPDMGPVGNKHVIDGFSTAAGLTGGYSLVTGSVPGQYAAPYGDTTQYLAVRGGQAATLAISPAVKSLSFYWGSIDAYNTVKFFSGATQVGSFTGGQIPAAPADGSPSNPVNNRRVNFSFDGRKSPVFSLVRRRTPSNSTMLRLPFPSPRRG